MSENFAFLEKLQPGLAGKKEALVTVELCAEAVGSGTLPVLATPAMIALMEGASVAALEGLLPPSCSSVGSSLEVRHLAASPRGATVEARSVLSAVEGRRLVFSLEAWDQAGKVGEGRHERVVVENQRFLAKAESRRLG